MTLSDKSFDHAVNDDSQHQVEMQAYNHNSGLRAISKHQQRIPSIFNKSKP